MIVELTEDWFIAKGVQSFLKDPDSVTLDRQIANNKYIQQTIGGNTRVSYLLKNNKWKQ